MQLFENMNRHAFREKTILTNCYTQPAKAVVVTHTAMDSLSKKPNGLHYLGTNLNM